MVYFEHFDVIEKLKSPQEKIDIIHDLLTIEGIHEDIRDELRGILSNILIKKHMDEKYPRPVKEKKPRATRKKKITDDVPLEQNGLDAPVVAPIVEPASLQV